MSYEKEVKALNSLLLKVYTLPEGAVKIISGMTFEMRNPRPLEKQMKNCGLLVIHAPEIKDGFQGVSLSAFWITIAQRFPSVEAFFRQAMVDAGANPDRWRNAYTASGGWYEQEWCLRRSGENSDTGLRAENLSEGIQQVTPSGKTIYIGCDDVVLKPKADEPQIVEPGKCWNCGVHVE